jgi:hypothetical protein
MNTPTNNSVLKWTEHRFMRKSQHVAKNARTPSMTICTGQIPLHKTGGGRERNIHHWAQDTEQRQTKQKCRKLKRWATGNHTRCSRRVINSNKTPTVLGNNHLTWRGGYGFFSKKNKYSTSRVVGKKILNETKNHKPPFKLNGRSLTHIYKYI